MKKTSPITVLILVVIAATGAYVAYDLAYGPRDPHDRHGFVALVRLGFAGFLLVTAFVGFSFIGIETFVARRRRKRELQKTFE